MQFEQSLPVAFGAETAKWICVGAIDITQISVAGMLLFTLSVSYIACIAGVLLDYKNYFFDN